jgi:hypothetical protein
VTAIPQSLSWLKYGTDSFLYSFTHVRAAPYKKMMLMSGLPVISHTEFELDARGIARYFRHAYSWGALKALKTVNSVSDLNVQINTCGTAAAQAFQSDGHGGNNGLSRQSRPHDRTHRQAQRGVTATELPLLGGCGTMTSKPTKGDSHEIGYP